MEWAYFFSVLCVCATTYHLLLRWIVFQERQLSSQDASKLSDELVIRIKALEEMKSKMEMLLLKNGLGR